MLKKQKLSQSLTSDYVSQTECEHPIWERQRVIISLSDLLNGIRQRKAELCIDDTPERPDEMRNNGLRRAERKRAMLARIDERARNAGVMPLKAEY